MVIDGRNRVQTATSMPAGTRDLHVDWSKDVPVKTYTDTDMDGQTEAHTHRQQALRRVSSAAKRQEVFAVIDAPERVDVLLGHRQFDAQVDWKSLQNGKDLYYCIC